MDGQISYWQLKKAKEAQKLLHLQQNQIQQLQAECNAYKQEYQAQILKIQAMEEQNH